MVVSSPDSIAQGSNLYARIWSSSFVLHRFFEELVAHPFFKVSLNSTQTIILEAGCGMGLLSCEIAKIFQGKENVARNANPRNKSHLQSPSFPSVTGFDFVHEAVEISRINAELHHFSNSQVSFFQYNWHSPFSRPDLIDSVTLLLGSDILYMSNSISSLAKLLFECLDVEGVGLLIDPGRGNESNLIEYIKDHYDEKMWCRLIILTKNNLIERKWMAVSDSIMSQNCPEKINIICISKQENVKLMNVITDIFMNSNYTSSA